MEWQKFALETTSRVREEIEWSIHYAYDTFSPLPRVLLIGDSICNGYQPFVREKLAGRMSVSFWASSKCVTDPDYFRELEFILDYMPYDVISFNNGLHSLTTDRTEWQTAYRRALDLIYRKCPGAKVFLTLCTPLTDPALTEKSRELNAWPRRLDYPIIDLFTPTDALDRERYWVDTYHFNDEAKGMQAQIIAEHLLK